MWLLQFISVKFKIVAFRRIASAVGVIWDMWYETIFIFQIFFITPSNIFPPFNNVNHVDAEREVAVAGRAAAAPVLDHLLDPVRPRLPVQPPALLPLPGPPPAHASRSQLESSSCSFHCICSYLTCANNCSRVLQTLSGRQPFCLRTDVSVFAIFAVGW